MFRHLRPSELLKSNLEELMGQVENQQLEFKWEIPCKNAQALSSRVKCHSTHQALAIDSDLSDVPAVTVMAGILRRSLPWCFHEEINQR